MLKKIFRRPSADKVAAQYSSYADFARHATKAEKEVIFEKAIKEANKLQRAVAAHAKN